MPYSNLLNHLLFYLANELPYKYKDSSKQLFLKKILKIAPLIFFVFTFNIFKKFLESINKNAFRLNSVN